MPLEIPKLTLFGLKMIADVHLTAMDAGLLLKEELRFDGEFITTQSVRVLCWKLVSMIQASRNPQNQWRCRRALTALNAHNPEPVCEPLFVPA